MVKKVKIKSKYIISGLIGVVLLFLIVILMLTASKITNDDIYNCREGNYKLNSYFKNIASKNNLFVKSVSISRNNSYATVPVCNIKFNFSKPRLVAGTEIYDMDVLTCYLDMFEQKYAKGIIQDMYKDTIFEELGTTVNVFIENDTNLIYDNNNSDLLLEKYTYKAKIDKLTWASEIFDGFYPTEQEEIYYTVTSDTVQKISDEINKRINDFHGINKQNLIKFIEYVGSDYIMHRDIFKGHEKYARSDRFNYLTPENVDFEIFEYKMDEIISLNYFYDYFEDYRDQIDYIRYNDDRYSDPSFYKRKEIQETVDLLWDKYIDYFLKKSYDDYIYYISIKNSYDYSYSAYNKIAYMIENHFSSIIESNFNDETGQMFEMLDNDISLILDDVGKKEIYGFIMNNFADAVLTKKGIGLNTDAFPEVYFDKDTNTPHLKYMSENVENKENLAFYKKYVLYNYGSFVDLSIDEYAKIKLTEIPENQRKEQEKIINHNSAILYLNLEKSKKEYFNRNFNDFCYGK